MEHDGHDVPEEQDHQDRQLEHDGHDDGQDVQQLELQQTNQQLQQLRLQFELLHRQHEDMTLQYRQAEMDIAELSELIRCVYLIKLYTGVRCNIYMM